MQDVMAIYRSQKKRRGRSVYLLSVEAEAVKDGERLPVRLVYVRNKNKRSDYLVLVSTDLTLSEEEIIQTYGKRWNIEVFFKMCKSYLKLGKVSCLLCSQKCSEAEFAYIQVIHFALRTPIPA